MVAANGNLLPGNLHPDYGTYSLVLHSFPPPQLEQKWQDFLRKPDFPSAYVTPSFFLEPFWDMKGPFAVLAFKETEIVGVLTGLHTRDRMSSGLPSRPQLCIRDDSFLA